MIQRKHPVRMCVACRQGNEKERLIRVVKTKSGVVEQMLPVKPTAGELIFAGQWSA